MGKRPNSTPTTEYGVRPLQIVPECKGRDVWELQIKLLAWGSGEDNDGIGNIHEPMKVTGTFDARTRDAVKRFQKALTLPVTGIADPTLFRALDREAALYPVFPHQMKCPCVTGANDGPILCRCEKHPENGKCTGFGKGRFDGKFLLDGKKLADNTDVSGEKLDLYDIKEYPGIDKALAWAVRGLMRRASVTRLGVSSGYRCWEDNYHQTDERRWRHRRLTFHLGKAIEFFHDGDAVHCTETGANLKAAACAECARIREVAMKKCGFQLRWQEPDRVSVAEGVKDRKPPSNMFAVHVNTVRRLEREDDDFVKTYFDSVQPLSAAKLGYSFPVDLGEGKDPRVASSEKQFLNTEKGPGGWYPLGLSRFWHGGIHLYAAAGTTVHAIADGEVVACRVGEDETKHPYGSRNFVLLRHEYATKKYYSLYFHLDAEQAAAAATIRWRKMLAMLGSDHIEAVAPCPFFKVVAVDGKNRLKTKEQEGLAPGEFALTTGGNIDPKTLDANAPPDSTLVKLSEPVDTYAYTKLENKVLANAVKADRALDKNVKANKVVGLKNPIRVTTGEALGKIAAAPTDARAKDLGTFVHVEIFSADAFLTGAGWQDLDAGAAAAVPDRAAILQKLLDKNMLALPPDKVLLDEDMAHPEENVFRELWRAVVLKMPSEWALDWKPALRGPESLTFIKSRADLGDAFNEYRWWDDAKSAGAALPASSTVIHYHPIAAILAMAYA